MTAIAPLLVAYVLSSSAGVLLLRHSLAGASLAGAAGSPLLWVGGVMYALSFGLWLLALRSHQVSVVYPLFVGASLIGVAIGGGLFLGETIGLLRATGILVVILGLGLVVR